MKTSPNHPNENEMLEHCDELFVDDGISPQELEKRKQSAIGKQSRGKPNHHSRQLCNQIYHAIDEVITCDCGDPVLDDLRAVWVRPVCKSSTLEVMLTTPETDVNQIDKMHEALKNVSEILRSAVAGSITRKRVPQLTFRIVPEKQRD
ncbi:hypothetical protein OAM04_01080 [bacterium]|nr:hypothetical protein [bacterium]